MKTDVVIIGAGAAGMMCAIEAARRGRRVLVLEGNRKPGEKIRISGGGRCNFTNRGADPRAHYLSANRKFALSAMRRFTPDDFIARLDAHAIAWHEKKLGQFFCDQSAQQVVDMLTGEMAAAGAELRLGVQVIEIGRMDDGSFLVRTGDEQIDCQALVIATGGKSIPKMGATGFGYEMARQFGLDVEPLRPGLVPLTFSPDFLARLEGLAGVSVDARVSCGKIHFDEALLFTHRGLSGPAILQISNYWREGDPIAIDLAPQHDVAQLLANAREAGGKRELAGVLAAILPTRLAQRIAEPFAGRLADFRKNDLTAVVEAVKNWRVKPTGTEGYRTAEVTLGGVATGELDAQTMETRKIRGLYFIGEVVDVTGWLGGYNFQWAWASGWVAGQSV